MAESSLSLGFSDLRSEIGYFLGYTRDSGNWSAGEITEINAVLSAGLRQFYFPPPLGQGLPHEWSFLRPITTIPTVADTSDYTLPDDFAGMEGDMTFAASDNVAGPVEIVGEHQIRKLREGNTSSSGIPRFGSVRPKTTDGTTGQRFQLNLWPTPDAVYTLYYRYKLLPSALTSIAPYPYGGAPHAETLKASCLAAAEIDIDDEKGPRWAHFQAMLAASIAHDRLAQPPEKLGYNGDYSDSQARRHYPVRLQNVSYNGVVY